MALTFIVPGLDEAASEKIIGILQNRLSQEQEAALERDRGEFHRRT